MVEYDETPKGRELMREPIVAWAVTVHSSEDGDDVKYTTTEPITARIEPNTGGVDDAHSGNIYAPDDAFHFEVVPAEEGGYKVWGEINERGDMDPLGFEYPGKTTNPDWDEVIDKKWGD